MKKIKVVKKDNLPLRSPLVATIAVYLLLDKLGANEIAWAITGTLMGLAWIGSLVRWIKEEPQDIFSD